MAVYETDPGVCPVAGFGINSYEPLGSVTIILSFFKLIKIALFYDVTCQTMYYHTQ